MIYVVNKYNHKPTSKDIYIGRGSPLGNPYTHLDLETTRASFQTASREESINLFENYINEKINQKDQIICDELNRIYLQAKENNVYLVCSCRPKSCHGNIIKKIIDSKL